MATLRETPSDGLLQAAPTGGLTLHVEGWALPVESLVRALVVIVITLALASRVRHWFERATSRTSADAGTRLLVGRLLSILVLIVGAATLLDTFGIPLSAVVTFVGVVGLAISLALQDILKNFFAGLYLLFERPFRLGDVVVVKDQCGVVETIGIRTTTLRTEENVEVVIPNMTIFAEVITNRTQFKPKAAVTDAKENASSRPTVPVSAQPQTEGLGEPGSPRRSR